MAQAVGFEEVTKRYPRGWTEGQEPRYASLRHDLASLGRRLRPGGGASAGRRRGTLALQGVSFRIQEGESFAIVGPNGAGKSTALKLIARISYPTSGKLRIRGRVAALMEVGSGVHPELTGRENIWLYGQILGMSRVDIRRRFDEIVWFSELGPAVDTPVKFFSSGMQLRLGFSIAAHLEPDVFVVDEALAVGDAGFQARCVERMTELVSAGHTLVFVSHDLFAVETLCDRAVFLEGGGVKAEGPARDVLAEYLSWLEDHRPAATEGPSDRGPLSLEAASCHDSAGAERYRFEPGEGMEIRLRFTSSEPLRRPHVIVGISDGRPGLLVQMSMVQDGAAPDLTSERWECRCRIGSLPLRPRAYELHAGVYGASGYGWLMSWRHIGTFRVGAGPSDAVTSAYDPMAGVVQVPYSWEVADVPSSDRP